MKIIKLKNKNRAGTTTQISLKQSQGISPCSEDAWRQNSQPGGWTALVQQNTRPDPNVSGYFKINKKLKSHCCVQWHWLNNSVDFGLVIIWTITEFFSCMATTRLPQVDVKKFWGQFCKHIAEIASEKQFLRTTSLKNSLSNMDNGHVNDQLICYFIKLLNSVSNTASLIKITLSIAPKTKINK